MCWRKETPARDTLTRLRGRAVQTSRSSTKRNVLHRRDGNPMGGEGIESSPTEMDLGVMAGEKLNMSHLGALLARKPTMSWASAKRKVASRSREGILRLYSALVQFCCPQHQKDLELSEQIQRRARKLIRALEKLPSPEKVGAAQPENRRLHGDLKATFQHLKRSTERLKADCPS